jgi:hypothetical protein
MVALMAVEIQPTLFFALTLYDPAATFVKTPVVFV